MWMKAGVLGDTGIEFSNLSLWAMAAFSIAVAFSSIFSKAREEKDNGIKAREENDNGINNGINRLPDDILGNIVSRLNVIEASRTSKAREENDNGINRLPDDILGNIVSRLNVIEASRTSKAREENDNGINLLPDDILGDIVSRLNVIEASRTNDNGINRLPDDILGNIVSHLNVIEASRTSKAREENDNGINLLPDDILGDIVSRLNVIEASRTSILSRRWRKIWTMNPQLRFYCPCYLSYELGRQGFSKIFHQCLKYDADRQRFFKDVNQCLKLYSGRKLKSFFMHCCFLEQYPRHLVQWMQSSALRDVEELYLGQSCFLIMFRIFNELFAFSFKLIDGLSKLRKLELKYCYVETSFVGQCNSLVTINLMTIPLARHELSDILLFCPNLRSLFLRNCELPLNLRISGQNLKLETLDIHMCHSVGKLDISDCNLVSISINTYTKLEISTSSLPKLETMYLQTWGMDDCFGDIPSDLPRLQFLSIQAQHQILQLPPSFEVFGNIRILYLLTKGDDKSNAFMKVDLWNFARVLTVCPLLEEFYLMVGRGPFCKGETKERCDALRRHKHLQHMELSGFSGTEEELEFAKFILTSAQVLRLLLLRFSFRKCDGRRCYLEGEEYLIREYAKVVCANLQGHAISTRARVEICC